MANRFNVTMQLQIAGPNNLKPIVTALQNQLRGVNATVNPKISPQATRAAATMAANLNNVQSSAKAAATSMKGMNVPAGAGTGIANIGRQMNAAANSAKSLQKEFGRTISEAERLGQVTGRAVRYYSGFLLIVRALSGVQRAFTDGVREALEFEREMVKLRQIGGDTSRQIGAISSEIGSLAKGFGASSAELAKVSVTLRQAGLSADDTRVALAALAKTTLAPTFDNINNTVEGTIAMMQQFGVQAKNFERSLGAINTVAGAFAVESTDLVTAIRKTGGAFKAASGDFTTAEDSLNQLISVFTSVRQTTRESADEISTGLRTIFSRLQNNNVIASLKSMGVELRHTAEESALFGKDMTGHFVGAYEAIKRLSDATKNLPTTDPRFAAIVEQIGGYRQISRVIPLLQQFNVTQKAYAVAQAGSNSLTRDADKASGAFLVRLTKLREEFLEFIRVVGNNRGLQNFLDLSLKLASSLIKVAKALEPLAPMLAIFAGAKLIKGASEFGRGFSSVFSGAVQHTAALKPKRMHSGGIVPGIGLGDKVPANLNIGDFVVRRTATRKLLGRKRMAAGGKVPALLEPGELIVPAPIVQKVGQAKLERINKTFTSGYSSPADQARHDAEMRRVAYMKKVRREDWYPARYADGGIVGTPYGRVKKSPYGRYYNLDRFQEQNVGQRVRLRRLEADPETGELTPRARFYAKHRQNRFLKRMASGGRVVGAAQKLWEDFNQSATGRIYMSQDYGTPMSVRDAAMMYGGEKTAGFIYKHGKKIKRRLGFATGGSPGDRRKQFVKGSRTKTQFDQDLRKIAMAPDQATAEQRYQDFINFYGSLFPNQSFVLKKASEAASYAEVRRSRANAPERTRMALESIRSGGRENARSPGSEERIRALETKYGTPEQQGLLGLNPGGNEDIRDYAKTTVGGLQASGANIPNIYPRTPRPVPAESVGSPLGARVRKTVPPPPPNVLNNPELLARWNNTTEENIARAARGEIPGTDIHLGAVAARDRLRRAATPPVGSAANPINVSPRGSGDLVHVSQAAVGRGQGMLGGPANMAGLPAPNAVALLKEISKTEKEGVKTQKDTVKAVKSPPYRNERGRFARPPGTAIVPVPRTRYARGIWEHPDSGSAIPMGGRGMLALPSPAPHPRPWAPSSQELFSFAHPAFETALTGGLNPSRRPQPTKRRRGKTKFTNAATSQVEMGTFPFFYDEDMPLFPANAATPSPRTRPTAFPRMRKRKAIGLSAMDFQQNISGPGEGVFDNRGRRKTAQPGALGSQPLPIQGRTPGPISMESGPLTEEEIRTRRRRRTGKPFTPPELGTADFEEFPSNTYLMRSPTAYPKGPSGIGRVAVEPPEFGDTYGMATHRRRVADVPMHGKVVDRPSGTTPYGLAPTLNEVLEQERRVFSQADFHSYPYAHDDLTNRFRPTLATIAGLGGDYGPDRTSREFHQVPGSVHHGYEQRASRAQARERAKYASFARPITHRQERGYHYTARVPYTGEERFGFVPANTERQAAAEVRKLGLHYTGFRKGKRLRPARELPQRDQNYLADPTDYRRHQALTEHFTEQGVSELTKNVRRGARGAARQNIMNDPEIMKQVRESAMDKAVDAAQEHVTFDEFNRVRKVGRLRDRIGKGLGIPRGANFRQGAKAVGSTLYSGAGKFGSAAAGGGLLAAAFAPQILESRFGTGKHVQAASGAIATGAIGAQIGGMAGGPIGAAVGAAAGGLLGFVTSLKDAENQIKEVEFDKDFNKFTVALNEVASGTVDFHTSLGVLTHGINQAGVEAARRVETSNESLLFGKKGDNTTLGKFQRIQEGIGPTDFFGNRKVDAKNINTQSIMEAEKRFREEAIQRQKQRADILAPQLPALQMVGQRIASDIKLKPEDLAVTSKTTQAQLDARKRSRLAAFEGAGGEKIAQTIADIQGIPVEQVKQSFDRLIITTNQTRLMEEARNKGVVEATLQFQKFTQLGQAVDAASTSILGLQSGAETLSGLLEGRIVAPKTTGFAEAAGQIGGLDRRAFAGSVEFMKANVGGAGGNLAGGLGDAVMGIDTVLRDLPTRIAEFTAKSSEEQVAGDIHGAFGGLLPNKDMAEEFQRRLNMAADAIDPKELQKRIGENPQKLAEDLVKDAFGEIPQVVADVTRQIQDKGNELAAGLAHAATIQEQINEVRDRVPQAQLSVARAGAAIKANQTGRPIGNFLSLEQLRAPFAGRQRRLAGANAFNPAGIAAEHGRITGQIQAQQVRLRQAGLSPDERRGIEGSNISLQSQASKLQKALEHLSQTSEETAAIQEKLNDIERERAGQLSFTEKLLTADPEQRRRMNQGAFMSDVASQQGSFAGFGSEQISKVLEHLRGLGEVSLPGYGGRTGNAPSGYAAGKLPENHGTFRTQTGRTGGP
jgi:hypothetical protein